jgi:hypothetical protein
MYNQQNYQNSLEQIRVEIRNNIVQNGAFLAQNMMSQDNWDLLRQIVTRHLATINIFEGRNGTVYAVLQQMKIYFSQQIMQARVNPNYMAEPPM